MKLLLSKMIGLLQYSIAFVFAKTSKISTLRLIAGMGLVATLGLTGSIANAQTGVADPLMHNADSVIKAFLKRWQIDGGTVAITYQGRLIYNRGFGYADQDSGEVAQPYHRFRIASLSKPITAIAIMMLVENHQLSLDDTVFGASKILNQNYYLSAITDSRIYDITVKNLLEHTAGWDRTLPCDTFLWCDPIEFPTDVTKYVNEPDPMGDSTLIKFGLKIGLNYAPGTTYAYSNIGFSVLGKVIEKITGQKYEDFVKENIADPLSLCDLHLGRSLLKDKLEREGEYNEPYTTVSCFGDNKQVPWQYGGIHTEASDAHGGWVASASDLVRLVLAVDSFPEPADILLPSTLHTMVTPSSVNQYAARGWATNEWRNWWHFGALPGLASFMCRWNNEFTWAFLFNSRADHSSTFWTEFDLLNGDIYWELTNYPSYNLFPPTENVSNLSATPNGTTVDLTWINGNGDGRLIVATEDSVLHGFPVDGQTYIANSTYGAGQDIGNNTFVVYHGNESSTSVTNLDPNKKYLFAAFEYYDNPLTGNHIVYKMGCRDDVAIDLKVTAIKDKLTRHGYFIYPNPAKDFLNIKSSKQEAYQVSILDYTGKVLFTQMLHGTSTISISVLKPGAYQIRILNARGAYTERFIKL